MNDEEKDVYIKGKIKDGHIPERIDNLFNNSIKIIENKGEETMEENLNMNQNNQNKPEKKKMPVALKRVLATAACLTLLLGGGNIYASTQGYDNIFFMIKYMITGQEVSGKENILSDRDITISYKTIEIAKGTQIQVNSLVIKNNEAKLKMHVDEKNAKEIITPLTYKVRDGKGVELCNYTSAHSQTHTDFKEELVLNNYNNDTKELILEIYDLNMEKIVELEINLESKEINVIGNVEEVTKISEEELKQYLSAFAMLNYNSTEYNREMTVNEKKMITALLIAENKAINVDVGLYSKNGTDVKRGLDKEKVHALIESFTDLELNENGVIDFNTDGMFYTQTYKGKNQYIYERDEIGCNPTCLEVTDISYVNGIYNVTFKFCYSTEENKSFGAATTVEDLPIYEMSMGLILDEENEYSKYRVSTMSEPTIFEEEEVTENLKEKDSSLNFDLSFLKIENQKDNKIYSPLSIKYALKMLEDATTNDSKLQITNLIGNYAVTKYKSNANMSLANSLFVRDTFKNSVKQKYINTLRNKYNAELIIDSFSSAKNVNSWISNKTLNLINNMLDEISQDTNFLLINALGIDMEWKENFLKMGCDYVSYKHENFHWNGTEQVSSHEFAEKEQIVSGMEITASINNYDIVTELGEENIRKTVGDEFRKWAKSLTENDWEYSDEDWFNGDLSEENIEKKLAQYLDGGLYGKYDHGYISEINSNYGRVDYSTDFSIYVDDNVKVFAKDLKEYEGTTLQYIGIMPTNEELDSYVKSVDETKINNIINNLKDLKTENFKEGVVTKITGYIPKFKFEYELNLKEDLQQLGITDVFEQGKANLTEICDDEEVYIADAVHKANIEFTQDGIKAAAATIIGGLGAGGSFDYIYDIPVEEIDLTFDNPYMFLIRDKETGEIWFMGTVYEPLSWEVEPERIR